MLISAFLSIFFVIGDHIFQRYGVCPNCAMIVTRLYESEWRSFQFGAKMVAIGARKSIAVGNAVYTGEGCVTLSESCVKGEFLEYIPQLQLLR